MSESPEVISIRFPSRLELLSVLDSITLSLCERMKFDEEACSAISMSVIEAGTNAIQHGHRRNAALPVDVSFQLYPDRLVIDVRDTGPGFEITNVNGDATSPEHLLDPRGRGIFIMRACMDQVDYDFSNGTLCHLVKLKSPASRES